MTIASLVCVWLAARFAEWLFHRLLDSVTKKLTGRRRGELDPERDERG